MDRFTEIFLPPQLRQWIEQHRAPQPEVAIVKQVPITRENLRMRERLAEVVPIRTRYRGPRSRGFCRECHRANALRMSIYHR